MGTLANGIKDIFSTSQTTATHLPVCASDGTPQGRISVGDLASVLGGKYINTLGTGGVTDLNNATKIGIYNASTGAAWNDITNKPNITEIGGSLAAGILFVTAGSSNDWRTQILICQQGNSYYRNIYTINSVYNSEWVRVTTNMPDFYKNYNSLASLSSALDVDFLKRGNAQSDLNQVRQHGLYYMVGIGGYTNIPSDAGFTNDSHGFMFVYGWSENRVIQIIVCGYGSGVGMWLRSADASYNFGSWGKIG